MGPRVAIGYMLGMPEVPVYGPTSRDHLGRVVRPGFGEISVLAARFKGLGFRGLWV